MSHPYLSAADAARHVGVSAKALRLYEDRGLLTPGRTPAGWRAYGPADIARAEQIASLRKLGLSLTQVASVLSGKTSGLEPALAAHQTALESHLTQLTGTIDQVRSLRRQLAAGASPELYDLTPLQSPDRLASFNLPWPWGGEHFELWVDRPLTWITGPLGSGKTRLAIRLADAMPGGVLLGLDREATATDDAHLARVECSLDWLAEDGATRNDALTTLITLLEAEGPAAFVVDLIEQGLDEPTQLALAAWLRLREPGSPPIFAMTRSSAMLDLAGCRPGETIILCPANHSTPLIVTPHAGSNGYEAVATCLAPPDVRARTEGIIAFRPTAA
ncbi:MAG: MerR family transcriptional regulator [Caulobacteraceae bacterium]|nr:MAG: MerR family transcriptional regulator [Caulobacteraceae bacterium]